MYVAIIHEMKAIFNAILLVPSQLCKCYFMGTLQFNLLTMITINRYFHDLDYIVVRIANLSSFSLIKLGFKKRLAEIT